MTQQENRSICDFVMMMPERGNKTALQFKKHGTWRTLSWTQYHEEILTVASALLTLGVKPGDKIAIMSGTRLEWSVCDYAIMGLKAITVPIYQTATADDVMHILKNSEARILFLESRSLLRMFSKIKEQCPLVEKVICFDNDGKESNIDSVPWIDVIAMGKQNILETRPQFEKSCSSCKLADVASLIYTSGTTGLPKGVVITHQQVISEVSEAFPYCGATPDDISLTFLPYAHVLGRIEHWGQMYIGFEMAYAESIEKIRNNLTEVRPTFLISVPRIFEKVYSGIHAQLGNNPLRKKAFQWAVKIGLKAGEYRLQRKPLPLPLFAEYQVAQRLILNKIKEAFGGRLRFAISGGAPISQDIELFFHACGILILEGYGLTETTAAICVNTPFNYRFGSVGRPIGETQIKIAEDGEILIKSKKVMTEYYKDPESTEKVFTDGWFHTGDIGEIMSSGDLKITDRKKDLIKTAGGKYVAPQKLENLLKTQPLISHVLIHGDNKKYIVALLTLDPLNLKKFAEEKGISFQNLPSLTQHPIVLETMRRAISEVNHQLASFETIKRFSILQQEFSVEAGELTPSLKVKRKVLDQKFQKQIQALYS
jgi:long-chain acyl-CoA synthetase